MPQIPNTVNPGDLIVADFFNSLVAVAADHESRLAKLEGAVSATGNPVINQVVPAGGVRPGDTLQLIGKNFGIPGLNSVTIAGAIVASFTNDSNDTLLKFTVPAITGIPALGQTATLNQQSERIHDRHHLLIAQPASASARSTFRGHVPDRSGPEGASRAESRLPVRGQGNASQNENYTVTPKVDIGWSSALVDGTGTPIVPPQIPLTLDANGNFDTFFNVQVSVPAGTADNVEGQLTVAVASVLNPSGLNRTSPPLPITVGLPPPGSQNAIIVGFSDVVNAKISGSTVTVTAGSQAAIDLTVATQVAGSYDVPVPVLGTPAGWTIALAHAAVGGDLPFTTTPANLNQPVRILVTAVTGAAPTSLTVTVVATNNPAVTGQLSPSLTLQTA